jgi:hypothetical protein
MKWPCPPALSLCLHGLSCRSATGAFVKPCLHWQRLHDNAGDSDSHYLLALATLGNATQIGLFLFLVTLPKVAKASTVTSPRWLTHVAVTDSFANKCCQCKWSLSWSGFICKSKCLVQSRSLRYLCIKYKCCDVASQRPNVKLQSKIFLNGYLFNF